MRLSLKYRIAVMIFLLEGIMMGFVLWQTLGHSFEASRAQFTANEQAMLDLVSGTGRIALLTEEYADLQPYLEGMLTDPRVVRVMLADVQGRVVASTHSGDLGMTLATVLTRKDHEDHYWRKQEINNAAGRLGELAIGFSDTALRRAYTQSRDLGIGIAAFGMAMIAIVGILMGFLLTRRLQRITDAAQRFASGELLVETGVQGKDELGELARSFEGMARSVLKNQQRLQENERYQRMLFEQSPIGLALCRMSGELVDINPAYAQIIGRSVEDTLRLTYWDITPESYADDEQLQLESLKTTGHYGPYEKEYIHKDGHRVPVRLQGALLEKNDEQMIWSSVEDITERKRAEEREISLGRILDGSLNEIYIVNADSLRFIQVNRGAMENLGYSMTELQGMTPVDLEPEFTLTSFEKLLAPLCKGEKEKIQFNTVHCRKDGSTYPVEAHLQLSTFESAPVLVVIILDITEREQTEEALRRSQKMEAIGQLSGGIAHDFNNQLGIIIGYLNFMQDHAANDQQLHQWVDTASRATLRCMDLTRQLLTFSRRQTRDKTVVNLNTTFSDLETMIMRSVTPEVEVQYFLAKDLGQTGIDPGEFQDAVLNLVINARDAMPDGGKLLIETTNKTLDTDYVALNPGVEAGDYVQLMLSDTGIGMDRDTLEHVFEPFFTTKPEGKGTGLGLAMVYGFVKRYGGHIKIYSEPGVGTTIRLYLPRCAVSESVVETSQNQESGLPTGSETVLIVDDEADLLTLAEKYLSDLGYRTRTAENAAQALAILKEGDQIDVLFSDVVMPGAMNGYELAQQATKHNPGLRVLMTSGFTSITVAHNGLARFTAHQLSKPYLKKDLAQRIRLVLDETQEHAGIRVDSGNSKDKLAGRTILVIDDEKDVRELLKLNLDKLGCHAIAAAGSDEAIAVVQQSLENGDTIDAIILDISLPGSMDGTQLAEKIRGIDPDARIIVSSGHTAGPEMTQYQDYGFNGALEKNFDREKIREVLEEVLRSA